MSKHSNHKSFVNSIWFFIAIIGIAAFVGLFAAIFAQLGSGRHGLLLALPAAIGIGFLFVLDRTLFLYILILSRPSLDVLLESTRFGSFGLGAVLNAAILVLTLLAVIKNPDPTVKVFKTTWLAFLVTALITLAIVPVLLPSIKIYLSLLSYAAMFAIAISITRSEQDFSKWMKALFFSSLIPVIYSFVEYTHGGYTGSGEHVGMRLKSTFAHPNIFAFYLVLMITLGFYFFKSKTDFISPKWRKLIPFYLLLLVGLLLMTKTRSAWVACFVYFGAYALFYERKYLILIVLTPVVALVIPEVRDRILDLTQGNQAVGYNSLNSYAWRKEMWTNALSWMTPAHYILGYGFGSFQHYSLNFAMANAYQHSEVEMLAHSVYVQLFFETGIVGLLSFVGLNWYVAKKLLAYYHENKLLIFSAIMLIIEFAFEAYSDNMLGYLSYMWYYWFTLGATYGYVYHKDKSSQAALNN